FFIWEFEVILFIQVIQFQPARENEFGFRKLLFFKFFHIIFVFDFSEDFFQQIFHCNNPRGSAKFIYYPGYTLALAREFSYEIRGTHAFRYRLNWKQNVFYKCRLLEKIQLMNVAKYVIDIAIKHHHFTQLSS